RWTGLEVKPIPLSQRFIQDFNQTLMQSTWTVLESRRFPAQLRAQLRPREQASGMDSPQQVTVLLDEWSHGNEAALNQLIPLVEAELHRLARQYMNREQAGHTLETTALVNEAYLRLVQVHDVHWQNRAHFFAISARIMRRIMIEHARKRQQLKRGGGALRITLDEGAVIADERSAELLALDEALETLTAEYPRKAQVVELRFFGGLTVTEAAAVLKVDERTVKRDWEFARAWLHQRVNGDALKASHNG